MGWWSLGPEEDDSSAGSAAPPPPPRPAGRGRGAARGVTGGRVSTGRMAARGRGPPRGAVKGPDGTIRPSNTDVDDDAPSLFTSIGRMVSTLAGVDDETTVASAKYGAGNKGGAKARTNAEEAQRRANEMANAMAWLTSGTQPEPTPAPAPAPGAGLFTGGDNWWEKEDASSAADDVSLFSAHTDFKTQEVPDLMALLKQKQEENAKKVAELTGDDQSIFTRGLKQATGAPVPGPALERATRMQEAMQWWKKHYQNPDGSVASDAPESFEDIGEMKSIMDWWSTHPNYVPPQAKGYPKDKKKALAVQKALRRYGKPELAAEAKARELRDAVQWWSTQGQKHVNEVKETEFEQSIFHRVNHLFGGWQLKGLPQPTWEKFSAIAHKEQALKRAQDIQACLELVLSGRFEASHPHYMQAMNRVKDLLVDWQLSKDNSAAQLEQALKWWNAHASTYDPLTASEADSLQFRNCKALLAKFGYKEGDDWDSRTKAIQKALTLWAKYKDVPPDQLDADTLAQLKMVEQALIQLKRDQLTPDTMKALGGEIAQVLEWYHAKGQHIRDLKNLSGVDLQEFQKAEGLLKLWGYKVDPTPEQLKEIADSLIFFRRNGYNPEIFDQYDGEEGAKFRRLQQAMLDWRLANSESSQFLGDEADGVAKEIDELMDWWRDEGEAFNPKTSRPADIFSAEKVKLLVDHWKPSKLQQTLTWKRSKKECEEIQEAINLWRDNGKTFDLESMRLMKPKERQMMEKLQEAFLAWRRQNASNLGKTEAEQTVKDMINAMNWWKKKGKDYDAVEQRLDAVPAMMRHKVVSDILADWHRENGGLGGEHEFKHLSAKDAKKVAADVADSLNWWQRNPIDVAKDMEDEEFFLKAQKLAHFWKKTNMSKEDREKAAEDINSTIRWMRAQSKDFHMDDVVDERAEELAKLFQVWGYKKANKPKAVAKDIEDSIEWWRRNQFSVDPTGKIPADAEKMKKLDQLAQTWYELKHPDLGVPDGQNFEWFRSKMLDEIQETLETLETKPMKPVGLATGVTALSDEQKRAQEMATALDWLKSNDAELDIDDDLSLALSLASFKKIDNLMPKSKDQSGPTDMSSALAWLRTKTDVDDETVNSFKKIDSVLNRTGLASTVKESGFAGALDWLRQRQAGKGDASDDEDNKSSPVAKPFAGLKPKSEEEKRAEEMAAALNWIKNSNATDLPDDDISLGLGSLGSFKAIDATGKNASTDSSALDWLRKQSAGTVNQHPAFQGNDDAESTNFGAVGARPKTAEESRADAMSDALAWLRKNAAATPDDFDDVASLRSTGTRFSTIKTRDFGSDKELDNALNWLRSKNPESLDDIDDSDFNTLGGHKVVPKTAEQRKAAQMNKALEWLRSNGAAFDSEEIPDFTGYDKFATVDANGRSAQATADEMAKALEWLRNKDLSTLDSMDDTFDSTLYGNASGIKSKEQLKAEAMKNALGWLRNKGDSGFDDAPNFEAYGLGDGFAPLATESDAKEMEKALAWLRGRRSGDDADDKFEKLDKVLPKKDGQKAEDRAKEMEDALAWLRAQGLDLDQDDSPVESFSTIGVVPVGLRSGDDRYADRLKALNWLRTKGEGAEIDPESGFAELDNLLPRRDGQSPEDRALEMENALAWLRANGVSVEDTDGVPTFNVVGQVPAAPRSQAERDANIKDALNWIREGKVSTPEQNDAFSKVDRFIGPAKPGQTELDRAKDMENALNWLRGLGVDVDNMTDPDVDAFMPVDEAKLSLRPSSSSSGRDEAAILAWLRNPKDSSLDPSGVFSQLHSSLPPKKGQSVEERAKDLANALLWMRNQGLVADNDDYRNQSFQKVVQVPNLIRSPEDRAKEMQDALDWLRNKGEKDEDLDPNGVFRKLDATLPRKKGQTLDERAKELENALNWMRQQGLDVPGADSEESRFSKPGFVESNAQIPEKQRADEMAAALNWLRSKDVVDDDTLFDPTGVFKKLDASLPQKPGQSSEERAKEMEKALNWMRGKGLFNEESELGIPEFDKVLFRTTSQRSPEDTAKDMADVVAWLRNQGSQDDTGANGMYQKLDSMLPRRKNQSHEERALEMLNALNWIRDKGLTFEGFDENIGANVPTVPVAVRSSETRSKDLEKIMNWMRKGKGKGLKKEDKYDPEGEFRKLDSLLPKKKGQTPENRAREIEGALDWLRNGGAEIEDHPEPAFEKVTFPLVGRRSPEDKEKDYQKALNWIRSNRSLDDADGVYDEFRKLDSLIPSKRGQTAEERARELEGALDWLREKERSKTEEHDDVPDLSKLGSLPVCRRSPEERIRDLDDVSTWIRHNKKEKYDPTGEFKKLDGIIPQKKHQSPTDRARDVESFLDWIRNHEVGLDNPGLPALFKKQGQAPFSRRTPEQRARDLADTMNWIRNKGKDDETSDPTGDFRKLDAVIPRKQGQSLEDRAREIESSLDWIRSNSARGIEDEPLPQIDGYGSLPIAKRSPEQRTKDLDDALNFLRNKGTKKEKKYDPTGDFKKLDKLLPKKKRGTLEDRARDIEGALDWMRNHNVKPGDAVPLEKFKRLGTIPVSRRTPEQRVKDLQDALNWTRNKGKGDDSYDPTSDFRTLDSMLPRTKGQSREDRARQIESALDWARTSSVKQNSDEGTDSLKPIPNIAVAVRSPEERKGDMASALNWIRNGKQRLDDPTGEFMKIDQMLPTKAGQSPEDRARSIEGVLDWMRNNGVHPSAVDELDVFNSMDSVPISHRTPEQRSKDLQDALNWVRNKGKNDIILDPTGNFRKLDALIKRKQGLSDDDRARLIEGALDWARQKGINPAFEDKLPPFKKTESVPVCKRTPEQRLHDQACALNWIRKGRKPSDDSTGDFRKIDQVLPLRIGQSTEDRARDIESALDWLRNQGVSADDDFC